MFGAGSAGRVLAERTDLRPLMKPDCRLLPVFRSLRLPDKS